MAEELTQDKVVEVLRDARIGMLTSVGDEGRLQSHPMTPKQVTDDANVWFFIDTDSEHAGNLRSEKRVNLAVTSRSSWLSVAGHAEIRQDRDKIDELWDDGADVWFPEGKDSPNVGLLYVESDSAQLWQPDGGLVGAALAYTKAKITGDRPEMGGSETTEL